MRGVPTIGGAGGIFEVFVPGLFLLLNLSAVVYFLPFFPPETKKYMGILVSNPAFTLIIVVSFGYLMGVILRIFQVEKADRWSQKSLRLFDKNCRRCPQRKNLYCHEDFPYIGWIGVICQNSMPHEVLDYYYDHWAHFTITEKTLEGYRKEKSEKHRVPDNMIQKLETQKGKSFRSRLDFLNSLKQVIEEDEIKNYEYQILRYACLWDRKNGRPFYNYCRMMIISCNEGLNNEINSRVSLTRYISGMFYALLMASLLLSITFASQIILTQEINSIFIFLISIYLFSLYAISRNLRFMRLSEVQAVFYASYKIKWDADRQ